MTDANVEAEVEVWGLLLLVVTGIAICSPTMLILPLAVTCTHETHMPAVEILLYFSGTRLPKPHRTVETPTTLEANLP